MPVANLVDKYRVGTQVVDRIYAGDKLIWPSTPQWPTGLIVHHSGSTAPQGWAVCDGSAHGSAALLALLGSANTPNLTDMFVRTTAGGANTATLAAGNLPLHNHGTTSTDSSTHTHSGSSGYMNQNATHTHSTVVLDNNQRHYHLIAATATGTVSAWHEHTSLIFNEGDGGDGDGSWVDQSPTYDGNAKDVGDTANPSANHQHYLPATTSGLISAGHYHGASVPAADPAHGHDFSVSGSGTHTHAVNSEGGGGPVSVVPEHYALVYIIRL